MDLPGGRVLSLGRLQPSFDFRFARIRYFDHTIREAVQQNMLKSLVAQVCTSKQEHQIATVCLARLLHRFHFMLDSRSAKM